MGASPPRSAWGPPAQQPRQWTPAFLARARSAGLMLWGAIFAGSVLAVVLGLGVWLVAVGLHHAASG